MKKLNDTVIELILGIIFYSIIFGIIGFMIAKEKGSYVNGMILGGIAAILLMIDMYVTIWKSCSRGEKSGNYAKSKVFLRALGLAGIFAFALYFSDVINVIGVLLGMFALKLAAYSQPFFHKLLAAGLRHV